MKNPPIYITGIFSDFKDELVQCSICDKMVRFDEGTFANSGNAFECSECTKLIKNINPYKKT